MSASVPRQIKVLLLTLFVISCQNTVKKDGNRVVTFDIKELPEITSVKLSDLGFVDIEYIPLETTENCVISTIQEIKVGKGYFLIIDYNKIYKFLNDGSFVAKIGTEGRGPDEFMNAHDVEIDEDNHDIYLVSAWQKKFNVYSEQGEFIRSFHCPQSTTSFQITEDGILCYNSNIMGNMVISFNLIDTLGRTIKNFSNKYIWNRVQTSAILNEILFYRFDNQLFKKEIYTDTIYLFDNKVFKPHLIIEHGEKLLTTAARSKYNPEYLFEKYITQDYLFEFGDYLYYEFMYDFKIGGQNIVRGLIGSKLDNSQVLIDAGEGLINDLDGGPNIQLKTIKDNNTLIFWISSLELKKIIKSDNFKNVTPKYPEKKIKLEKLANNLKETDNPVLIMVRLKK